ncbi:hypothetical protein [Millisia brevis]|uniref:hypothetical protein n=1 Tax=Millisia brevis TaxID=264148 RepID=UPI000830BADE|nr:hypothetical protein [Millisia brevis]
MADGFSAAERAAMKQRAEELAAMKGVKGTTKKIKELQACIDAIGELTGLDKQVAERYHVIVTEEAPDLDPKTWYGFPSYARDGEVLTFVQPATKFDTRYPTVGFQENAQLDDGAMWPVAYAVVEWNDDVEKRLRAIVRKAAGA